jgi:hypothetical protein
VKQFGLRSIATEKASNFEGFHRVALQRVHQTQGVLPEGYVMLDQHSADLHHLRLAAAGGSWGLGHQQGSPHHELQMLLHGETSISEAATAEAATTEAALQARQQLLAEVQDRARIDAAMEHALAHVLGTEELLQHRMQVAFGTGAAHLNVFCIAAMGVVSMPAGLPCGGQLHDQRCSLQRS